MLINEKCVNYYVKVTPPMHKTIEHIKLFFRANVFCT